MSVALAAAFVVAGAGGASADDIRDRQYWLSQSGIEAAWKVSKGEGVKVAVIDSGVDKSHPDLKGAMGPGTDISGAGDADGSKGIGAEPEHGTLVATMLGGRGHKTASPTAKPSAKPKAKSSASAKATEEPEAGGPDGVIGVAPEAELLSVSVWLGSDNPSGKNIDDQIPAAVKWAVDQGAKVINMSLGSTSTAWPQSWDDAFAYAEQRDVVIVAAAGNRKSGSEQVGAPATIPGVLAVGGLDRDGSASVDSSSQGISLGVSAPAEDLIGGLPGGGYAQWSGTSGAAPIVSGVAALIRSKYPDMSAAQVINRIISTAKPAGDGVPNAIYGYGILDAEAALTADVPVVEANPLGSISDWIRVHRRGQEAPPAEGGETGNVVPQPEPTLVDQAAPSPIPAAQGSGALPATLVIGSLVLLLGVGGVGAWRILLARRRAEGAQEAATGGPSDGGPSGGGAPGGSGGSGSGTSGPATPVGAPTAAVSGTTAPTGPAGPASDQNGPATTPAPDAKQGHPGHSAKTKPGHKH
ncbi:peptidase S8 [Arthrobacter stackebrandtii]|nr:peptidase S8 [Arthrobacter stackebrandtii]